MVRRSGCRLSSHRAGIILVMFSFVWGIYLVKIQLEDRRPESKYLKDKILSFSKDYIHALAREKGVLGIENDPQSVEAQELKKATAMLLQNMLDRIQHLENQVENVIVNSTSKFESLHKQILNLNSSITNSFNKTKGIDNNCRIPNDLGYPTCGDKVLWLQKNWKTNSKFAKGGVNGTLCSILHYLSKVEHVCPEKESTNSIPTDCTVPEDTGFPECPGKVKWMQKFWMSDPKFQTHGVNGDLCSILVYLSEVESWCPLMKGRVKNRDCPIPSNKMYPDCAGKIAWMRNFWTSDPCYQNDHGVNGTICSFIVYLSEVETWCPLFPGRKDVHEKPVILLPTRKTAFDRDDVQALHAILADKQEIKFKWIKHRIQSMWSDWQKALKSLREEGKLKNGVQKRILVHIGVLAESSLHFAENAYKGGPLGELVQWSDLITTLYLLGHNITVTANTDKLRSALGGLAGTAKKACPIFVSNDFDLVYIDYYGIRQMSTKFGSLMPYFKCKLRVLDSFGTEAQFNYAAYKEKVPGGSMGQWGRHNLNLRQYMTMFPHSPDNTFLGFLVGQAATGNLTRKKAQALVYGKHISMWQDPKYYHNFLDVVNKYMEVHVTVGGASNWEIGKHLPQYVVNHGVVTQAEVKKLLQESKVFIGIGFPYEGPAALEAIANGCFFINPKFEPPLSRKTTPFLSSKPTLRELTSQNPYMEDFVGKPQVYTFDVKNHVEVERVIKEMMLKEAVPYMPREFTHEGMLERVDVFVQKQDFCSKEKQWPSLNAMKIRKGDADQSCKTVCRKKGLICEPEFFTHINSKDMLSRNGFPCNRTVVEDIPSLVAPGYRAEPPACILQTQSLLYSCTATSPSTSRLCPCRDFIKGQVALCEKC